MSVIVKTEQGEVKGLIFKSLCGIEYMCYLGIPYAEPPVGPLRFKAPQEPKPWTGVYDASKEGKMSVTFSETNEILGDEDCLYLNVFRNTTTISSDTLKPVMFWIHGGNFYQGSSAVNNTSPHYLVQKNVIVVTFNYRLGILGFLKLDDPSLEVPGNAGFKDMIMALKWIQRNIIHFGGDAKNVTLFGQGSGATSAHLLVTSPMAKGLFQKAILQSGTAFVGFDKLSTIPQGSFQFAAALGCQTISEKEAYEFLTQQPKEKLIEAFRTVTQLSKNKHRRIVGPVIENTPLEEMFLPYEPEVLYSKNLINHVPLIIGGNSADGMLFACKGHEDNLITPMFTDMEQLVPPELALPRGSTESVACGEKIAKFYYGDETPSRRNLDKFTKYQTDVKLSLPIKKTIELHKTFTPNQIFMYRFSFESERNLCKTKLKNNVPRVCQGDELLYLIGTKDALPFRANSFESKTKERLVSFWTNFAKNSDPNSPGQDINIPISWKPVQKDMIKYLNIGKNVAMVENEPDADRMAFWEEIYLSLKRKSNPSLESKQKDHNSSIQHLKWLSLSNTSLAEKTMFLAN